MAGFEMVLNRKVNLANAKKVSQTGEGLLLILQFQHWYFQIFVVMGRLVLMKKVINEKVMRRQNIN